MAGILVPNLSLSVLPSFFFSKGPCSTGPYQTLKKKKGGGRAVYIRRPPCRKKNSKGKLFHRLLFSLKKKKKKEGRIVISRYIAQGTHATQSSKDRVSVRPSKTFDLDSDRVCVYIERIFRPAHLAIFSSLFIFFSFCAGRP